MGPPFYIRRFGNVDDVLTTAERTKTFRHQWFGDIDVLQRLHGDPSWNGVCTEVWTLCFTRKKFDDQRHHLWKFENFTMKVVKLQLSLGRCFITLVVLEGQVIRIWKFQR